MPKYHTARPQQIRLDSYPQRIEHKLQRNTTRLYTLPLLLYTEASKKDRTKPVEDHLTAEQEDKYSKYIKREFRGYKQFWKGQIRIKESKPGLIRELNNKLVHKQDMKEWKLLYISCMGDDTFYNREIIAPGYLEAIYILNYD